MSQSFTKLTSNHWVVQSELYFTNSGVFLNDNQACLIDPGIFPQEIKKIKASVGEKQAEPQSLVITHSHWDHVVGHGIFPGAPLYTSAVLARSIREGGGLAAEAVAKAREYDSRWYVERPWGYAWPADVRGIDDGGWFNIGDLDIEAFLVPGHAPDCLAARVEGCLLVGDYLSPCEIPFVDDLADPDCYDRILQEAEDAGVDVSTADGDDPRTNGETYREDIRESEQRDFDRLFIELLDRENITVVVKGGPAINDALREDAEVK